MHDHRRPQNSEFADQISDHEPEVVRLRPVAAGGTPSPVIPEAPYAVLLLAVALALGTTALVRRRRVA